MPFDGFGNFLRLYSWVVDATNSVKIRADRHDEEDNNFTAGLSNCIARDGQSVISQNTPWNSRRITALADPIDPQDAATRAYADTKLPLDGSAPITGDVTVKNPDPSLTLDGTAGSKNSIFGQKAEKNRWEIVLGNALPETGNDAGSDFELVNYHDDGTLIGDVFYGSRATGLVTVKANPVTALGIATKQYADTTAVNAASSKLPITGGTVTGTLQVNGSLIAVGSNAVFFGAGAGGYLQWNGGGSYTLGGGGTVWHSGNFNPASSTLVSDARLTFAGDWGPAPAGSMGEPYAGAVMTGANVYAPTNAFFFRMRYLQLHTTSWYTVGYLG